MGQYFVNGLMSANLAFGGLCALAFSKMSRLRRKRSRFQSGHLRAMSCAEFEQARRTILADSRYADPLCLVQWGRKVYSQNDEDGIIAEIFRRIGVASRRFIEIGSGDGRENNTVTLLLQGWSGGWIDGKPRNARRMRKNFAPLLERGQLKFAEGFVTKASVQTLIDRAGGLKDIDLLSMDIDGNDYHILEMLALDARVIVLEYNSKFVPPIEWVMPYDPAHVWDNTDYFGASLASYERLLREKGYSLVGCNITGTNAFFVRNDMVEGKFLAPFTAERHFEECRFWMSPGFISGHPFGLRLK